MLQWWCLIGRKQSRGREWGCRCSRKFCKVSMMRCLRWGLVRLNGMRIETLWPRWGRTSQAEGPASTNAWVGQCAGAKAVGRVVGTERCSQSSPAVCPTGKDWTSAQAAQRDSKPRDCPYEPPSPLHNQRPGCRDGLSGPRSRQAAFSPVWNNDV